MEFWLVYTVIGVYVVALVLIFVYSLLQLNLLINYITFKKRQKNTSAPLNTDTSNLPTVTVQLPVFNELYVMERLLLNISQLDYPKEKLEIQVLDDSTDESVALTKNLVEKLKSEGLNILHLHRKNRDGFKAGALKEGLVTARGELIAIFDADFMPKPDWLKKTVPHFANPEIGVVQTRWGHLNRNFSTLTKVQAFALDAHFTLEQVGRNSKGHFINFNGTAGIWRKQCILDAGNWEGDTLTEDLDLSYRAQLKNWKFKYLEDVETPAELPIAISAARSQQFRWNKGGAENFRKNAFKVLSSKNVPFKTKAHGLLHLLNSAMFLCALLVSLLSIPMLYLKNLYGHLHWVFVFTSLFLLSTLILFSCYWIPFKTLENQKRFRFLKYVSLFFTFFSVAMGFTLHNSLAVLQGYWGKKSEFVRTPKFNISDVSGSWKTNRYLSKKLSLNAILEAMLCLYFIFGLYSAFVLNDFGLIFFHLMLTFGFGYVAVKSVTVKA